MNPYSNRFRPDGEEDHPAVETEDQDSGQSIHANWLLGNRLGTSAREAEENSVQLSAGGEK